MLNNQRVKIEMTKLQQALKAHKATPNNKTTQEQYCRVYAKAGYPGHDESRCLVPWCKRRCRKFTFCSGHNTPNHPAWLGKQWEADLDSFEKYNWQYHVDVEYETEHNCHAEGCDEEGICRCGWIVNPRIESISHENIVQAIVNVLIGAQTNIQAYCIDRVVRSILNSYFEFEWDIDVGGGYYGQEIDCVSLEAAPTITSKLKELLQLKTDKERIFYALNLEYGYILPKLKVLDQWTIEELPMKSVLLPQQEYQKKLKTNQIKAYETWNLPRGLVIEENGGYRVIDGYHRTQAAINQKLDTALYLVGKERK